MTAETEDREPEPLRRGDWSAEELDHLRRWYGLKHEQFIARDLGRPVQSIEPKAREIFDAEPHDGPWTSDEVERLRMYLGAVDLDLVGKIIGRSREAIDAQLVQIAATLSSEALTGEELVRFKRVYGTRTDEDLSLVFGRTLEVVQGQAATLCLSKDKAFLRRASGGTAKTRMPRWTDEELAQLRELYPIHSNLEIADRLGRSVKSVVSKAHNMGLKKDRARLQQMGRQNVRQRYDRGGEDRDPGPDGDGSR
ncbi:MAG: hypothetical protein AAF957_18720 [Planctomycetota bacterium]